mgnify:CR=1 FL=1
MNLRSIRRLLLLCMAVLCNVLLTGHIAERVLQINCFSYETTWRNLREHRISQEELLAFREETESTEEFAELLTMYFATEGTGSDTDILRDDIAFVKKYKKDDFEKIYRMVYAVWNDLERFPVGKIASLPDAGVSFANSWMQSRTFGGDRGHEGCDIMASVNERGIYPVYSMTDGTVENIGWLRLGGYRIGVRSDSGAYFYYAHLAEYAKEFQPGERVKAGTLLGFMGDTGYSDTPGTTGMFDVHLHLGIYLNDADGREFSVNSYPVVEYLYETSEFKQETGR